jgi:hypothetical protein
VRLVAVGSFQSSAGRVRITARVVDVVSGDAVADAKVDGSVDDIFDLQDEVAEQFAQELGAAPVRSDRRNRETTSLEAYRAVMEGWLRVESLDIRELPRAVADFERAVAIDPKYALAYTSLASAEFASYESTRADLQPAKPLLERAIAHGRQAVQLDDSLAEAHGALALILVSAWDTNAAIREARRAVALEPGNWRHLFRLGHASWGDDRLRAAEATLALYPEFAFAYFQEAMVHVARGHLTEAERVLRHGAAIQDRQIGRGERYPALGLHWLLGLVRLAQDDVEDALAEFERERGLPSRTALRPSMHARALGRGGAAAGRPRDEGGRELPRRAGAVPGSSAGTSRLRSPAADSRTCERPGDLDPHKPIEAALVRRSVCRRAGTEPAAADLSRSLERPPGLRRWSVPSTVPGNTDRAICAVFDFWPSGRLDSPPHAFSGFAQDTRARPYRGSEEHHDRAQLRRHARHRGLQPFLWTQFLGAFNDNLFKIVVSMLAVHAATRRTPGASCRSSASCSSCRSCSSPATRAARGRLQQADRAGRDQVARDRRRRLGLFAFMAGHLELTYVVLFLIALQATFFSPAKYGILPEMLPDRDLSRANGVLEMSTFVGDRRRHGDRQLHVRRAARPLWIIGVPAVVADAVRRHGLSLRIPRGAAASPGIADPRWKPSRGVSASGSPACASAGAVADPSPGHLLLLVPRARCCSPDDPLRDRVMGLKRPLDGDPDRRFAADRHPVGSNRRGPASGDKVEPRPRAIGSIGRALSSVLPSWSAPLFALAALNLTMVGFFGGLFAVPLNALLQQKSGDEEKGRLMATNNFLNMLAIMVAVGRAVALPRQVSG